MTRDLPAQQRVADAVEAFERRCGREPVVIVVSPRTRVELVGEMGEHRMWFDVHDLRVCGVPVRTPADLLGPDSTVAAVVAD